jgi:PAS domain S-box-containing protein
MALDDSKLKSLSIWQKALLFSIAYFLCADASFYLYAPGGPFIAIWLPAGLYLAVLLLNKSRDWPWLVLAVLPANLAFDLWHGTKPVIIFTFYFANTSEAVIGAWLIRRFVAERPTLATLKEFIGVLGFSAVFSTMLGATISAGMLTALGSSQSFAQSWINWWTGEALAILLLSSFILTWFSRPDATREPFLGSRKKASEAALLVVVSITLTWHLLFVGQGVMSPNKSPLLLPLLWAGLRFGPRGATAACLLVALPVAFFTTQFSAGLTPEQASSGKYVSIMQISLAVASMAGLIPAIILNGYEKKIVELHESEERFKNLAAAAFEGICISENGRILDVNNQFLTMFGYERRSEIIGRQIIELVAPECRDSVAERIRAGQETIYGHQLLRKDGGVFFAEAQAKMVRVGNQMWRMTALRDISERKQTEQALRESEEKFSKAFDSNPNGICITEMETGRYIAVNDSFCKVFGYSRDEMIGRTSLEMGVWENAAERERLIQPLRNFGSVRDLQMQTRDRNNQIKILMVSAELMELGGKQCLVSMLHDITSRMRAEAERAEAQAREARARAEYTFQLIASQEAERTRIARELHDSLGQNLLLIKNRAQLEMAKMKLSDDLREELQGISNLASQAITEVRQISHDLHPPQLDILGLTRAIQALIDNADESSGMTIDGKFDSVDDAFPREAATNIYRIVQECLNNILKHSRAKKARVTLERDVHEVQLRIEDNGCGFKTGENSNAEKGLGLKNIAERVRMLGGKIKLDSKLDKGTHIEITIPISAEQR